MIPEAFPVALHTLINQPSGRQFLDPLTLVTSSLDYHPDSLEVNTLDKFCRLKRYHEAIDWFERKGTGWLLSPRVHRLAAVACQEVGEHDRARREKALYTGLFEGILSTGYGTSQRPYHVSRLSDEYDVLMRFGKTSGERHLEKRDNGRWLD